MNNKVRQDTKLIKTLMVLPQWSLQTEDSIRSLEAEQLMGKTQWLITQCWINITICFP